MSASEDLARVIGRPPAGTLVPGPDITRDELQLAVRNHSMPLEGLHHRLTPVGLHYLLIHFDIPTVDVATWSLEVGGHVRNPAKLDLDAIRRRPAVTHEVTLECAGNGRALLQPRPLSQPWLGEAVGNAAWTGTPLRAILEEVGLLDGAVDVVFTGLDRGIQGGVKQQYERSLKVEDALRDEVILAYAVNGRPLPPQHGHPVRLIVPGWYGMTHVKWLRAITVLDRPFDGYQQKTAYHYRKAQGEAGEPVGRMLPRALMIPPGIPDFMSRTRFVPVGRCLVEGRAWSGRAEVKRVEFSSDRGGTWADAVLEAPTSPHAWRRWTFEWDAKPGVHELCVRARDAAEYKQPMEIDWNVEGVMNNAVQRVQAVVGSNVPQIQPAADGGDAGAV